MPEKRIVMPVKSVQFVSKNVVRYNINPFIHDFSHAENKEQHDKKKRKNSFSDGFLNTQFL